MSTTVKTRIVKIGNSQGIRIPKVVLEQLRLTGEVELEILADQLVVRPSNSARHGWDKAFSQMAALGDDQLLDPETLTPWDDTEWDWQ